MNRQLIEAASWRVACELIRRYPDRLIVIETHPADGQYDCLSIYESRDLQNGGFISCRQNWREGRLLRLLRAHT